MSNTGVGRLDNCVDDLAALSRVDGYVKARLTRRSWSKPAAIWRAFTDPDLLAQWLAPGGIEPWAGGLVRLAFEGSGAVIESRVSAFEDGRLVEFSWSQGDEPRRPVRLCVEPSGVGARVTVTVLTPNSEDAARACAGWEAHLEMLEAALDGAPIAFPFERFKTAREAYKPAVAAL
jgi:uncharacterized protein YndB with AHSA1/START domain